MKRCIIGAVALVLLFALTLTGSLWQAKIHQDLAKELARAADTLDLATVTQAQARWQRHRALSAVFTDHGPLEDIDILFAQLDTQTPEDTFRQVCLQLSSQLKALGEGQLPTLENLF